jgi:hypothetical protein
VTLTAPPPLDVTDPVPPDADDAVIRQARRRARRRRLGYAAVLAVAALVGAAMVLGPPPTEGPPDSPPAGADGPNELVGAGAQRHVQAVEPAVAALFPSTGVPWCVPDPGDPGGAELIVGAGPPVRTWCSYNLMVRDLDRRNYLFHTAGSTLLVNVREGVYRVADGRLTHLGPTGVFVTPRISHDGRYAAMATARPRPHVLRNAQCGEVTLSVVEIATADEVAVTRVPNAGNTCVEVEGIDDAGRVYVTVRGPDGPPHTVSSLGPFGGGLPVEPLAGPYRSFDVGVPDTGTLMYDMRGGWVKLAPTVNGHFPPIAYVTADGLAISASQSGTSAYVPGVSVEGVVDDTGRFTPQRRVPVVNGVWSPDRSYVAEGLPDDGVVVRPAADLTEPVVLDLPVDQFGPGSNIQWESATTLLIQSDQAYRCQVRSGACEVVDGVGWMALGENAWYGG